MDEIRDDIEQLISGNLEGLNDEEPQEGHFGRFEEKLKKQHKPVKITFSIVWKVAAAAVFVFLAVNQAVIYLTPDKKEITTLGAVSKEYSEVEFFYTNSIGNSLQQWENMKKAGLLTEEEAQSMENELQEFDQLYKKLQDDLKTNPYDERVINAMIEYYQAKLNVVNLILDKLQEVKLQNKTNHEIEI